MTSLAGSSIKWAKGTVTQPLNCIIDYVVDEVTTQEGNSFLPCSQDLYVSTPEAFTPGDTAIERLLAPADPACTELERGL